MVEQRGEPDPDVSRVGKTVACAVMVQSRMLLFVSHDQAVGSRAKANLVKVQNEGQQKERLNDDAEHVGPATVKTNLVGTGQAELGQCFVGSCLQQALRRVELESRIMGHDPRARHT